MPRPAFDPRHEAEESPYRRVNAWDDGAYFSSSPSPGGDHDHRAPRHNNNHHHHDRYARSPSPPNFRGRADHAAGAGGARPPLTRSKSTSAKAFAKQGLSQLQHLSPQWQKAAKAALQAGGMAALAQRNKSGAWTGAKGARVATAALGAAAADVWANRQKEKREGHNNNRDRSRDRGGDYTYERRSRDRSLDRSRDRGYDRDRSRDRSRDRYHDDSRRRGDYHDSGRDYHDRRDAHRGRDRSRDRGGYDDSRARGKSKKRGEIEVIGEMVGGFILDQIAKKATKVRS